MKIPSKVFHGFFDRNKYLYYRNEKEYRKGKYFVVRLPNWFKKANEDALKEAYRAGESSIKQQIKSVLSWIKHIGWQFRNPLKNEGYS